MADQNKKKKLFSVSGRPIAENQNVKTAGKRGPMLLEDFWFLEKLAHFDREVIPERRMHAKGSGAFGKFTVTHDITKYTKTKIFSKIGKETEVFVRFSTVAGSSLAVVIAAVAVEYFKFVLAPKVGMWESVAPSD